MHVNNYEISQKLYVSLFEVATQALKENAKKMAYKIIIPLISILREQTQELNKMKFQYQEHPGMLLSLNLEEFYDLMHDNEDKLYYLLELVKPYKDDEVFGEFYSVVEKKL
jgi:hypothetical protein